MIDAKIENSDCVIAQLNSISARSQVAVRERMRSIVVELRSYVVKNKLSGQVLRRRTGTLSRSIDSAVVENSQGVLGVVSTNVKYARAHEYGFSGAVAVKSHVRNIKKAFGRDIAPMSVVVNSFTRNMNLPVRSFLRSSLGENANKIKKSLLDSVSISNKQGGV